jgi:hypothetical protein
MNEQKVSAMERVKAVYPTAYASQHYDEDDPPCVIGYAIYDRGGIGPQLSFVQHTELTAWKDAASRLPATPESIAPNPKPEPDFPEFQSTRLGFTPCRVESHVNRWVRFRGSADGNTIILEPSEDLIASLRAAGKGE